MMGFVGGVLVIIGFVVLARYLGLVEKSVRVIALSREALSVLRDATLSDDEKELAMRSHAKTFAWLFLTLTGGAAIALLAPVAVIWFLDTRGLLSLEAVLEALLSPALILGGTIVMWLSLRVWVRRRNGI